MRDVVDEPARRAPPGDRSGEHEIGVGPHVLDERPQAMQLVVVGSQPAEHRLEPRQLRGRIGLRRRARRRLLGQRHRFERSVVEAVQHARRAVDVAARERDDARRAAAEHGEPRARLRAGADDDVDDDVGFDGAEGRGRSGELAMIAGDVAVAGERDDLVTELRELRDERRSDEAVPPITRIRMTEALRPRVRLPCSPGHAISADGVAKPALSRSALRRSAVGAGWWARRALEFSHLGLEALDASRAAGCAGDCRRPRWRDSRVRSGSRRWTRRRLWFAALEPPWLGTVSECSHRGFAAAYFP